MGKKAGNTFKGEPDCRDLTEKTLGRTCDRAKVLRCRESRAAGKFQPLQRRSASDGGTRSARKRADLRIQLAAQSCLPVAAYR